MTHMHALAALTAAVVTAGWANTARAVGTCSEYGTGEQVGTIEAPDLEEASGLAASHINPGVYWTLNDSGNPAHIFAIDLEGQVLATMEVTGAINVDWEDMEIGPCGEGCSCLFIGDIGDNLGVRTEKTIYRVPEPLLGEAGEATEPTEAFSFRYPDARHDAETLLVDPNLGTIYVVTKDEDGDSIVFRFPADASPGETATLEEVARIRVEYNGSGGMLATAGTVASDGARVVIRSLEHAQEYAVPEGETLDAAFLTTPLLIPLPYASQGEAIAFELGGSALITVSENLPAPVHRIPCADGTPIDAPARPLEVVCEAAPTGCGEAQRAASPVPGVALLLSLSGVGIFARSRRKREDGC